MFESDPTADARIRDLEVKLAAMPGSRVFVGLAEEYRRAGRLNESLAVLRQGLQEHPNYLSAQIAIARLFRELGRSGEAIEAFSKVLVIDRENLVAAKALADIYWDMGNRVEAIKKFKLYRGISGDRSYDERIAELEREIRVDAAPEVSKAPPTLPTAFTAAIPIQDSVAPLTPPPSFGFEEFSLEASDFPPPEATAPIPAMPPEETFDPNATMSISLTQYPAPSPSGPADAPELPAGVATEAPFEAAAEAAVPEPQEAAEEVDEPPSIAPPPDLGPFFAAPDVAPAMEPPPVPPSKTLADLYFEQGFLDDARKIYEKLLAADPTDRALARRLAELKGEPKKPRSRETHTTVGTPKERAHRLRSWLEHVRTNARPAEKV